jgi:hypothetical protein
MHRDSVERLSVIDFLFYFYLLQVSLTHSSQYSRPFLKRHDHYPTPERQRINRVELECSTLPMSLNLQGVHFLRRDGSIFSFPYPFFLGIFAGRSHAVYVPEQSLIFIKM